jgi:hypothetical protein
MYKLHQRVASLALAAASAAAIADDAVIPTPDGDRTNYMGDKVIVRAPVAARTYEYGRPVDAGQQVCILKGSRLDGKGDIVLNEKRYQVFEVDRSPEDDKDAAGNLKPIPVGSACSAVQAAAKTGQVIAIEHVLVGALPTIRTGLSYGTLLIPFKYHLGGDKSFSGSSSLGGYLGWRFDQTSSMGLSTKVVGFLGAANVPVTEVIDGQSKTQQMTGLTYGIGVLGEVKNSFQLGVVVGADRVSKSANYVNDGKPWLAVSLGFGFSN